ncbi:hypothetical protein Q4543_08920 [Salipiger sp. 1_MG-2023]|uniref:hypothetical protein n=1 Tax=Salipiger sp. 1_MG-2023 TaxID=3062665 RepID=UPI0026E2AD01|nr:hypothetical protein [Salipiger sp. 1_MG-2023]MDO6585640.1 hypothetical protein [Salipiger sp. 1_MG-2023]
MSALLALVLLAAESFAIDYGQVFRDHADDIMVAEPGVLHQELPGPVILERRGKRFHAEDQSGWGPAGCAIDRLFVAGAAVTACPDMFSPEQRDRVASQLIRGVQFFALNTVPQMSETAATEAMLGELARRRDRLSLLCVPGEPELAFAAHIAEDQSIARFGKIFAAPRLPVLEPCR